MSMIGRLRRASDEEVSRLLEHPGEIGAFLYPGDFEASGGETGGGGSAPAGGGGVGGGGASEGGAADLDIEKSWHGIHFVLTGSDWGGASPLNFLVSGGMEVGDEDVGYGPARAFTSAQVRAIHEALAQLPPEQFARRIDLAALEEAGIYPEIWEREDEEAENREFLTRYYAALRRYVESLAREGAGMLIYIS